MNEVISLFPILFLVYVLQCIVAAPPNATIFVVGSNLRGHLLRHFWRVGQSGHRLFLLNPLRPLLAALQVEPPPFVVRYGTSGEFEGVEFVSPAAHNGKVLRFDSHQEIGREGKDLLVSREVFVSFASEEAAARTAAILSRVQGVRAGDRSRLMKQAFDKMFSRKSLEVRLEQSASATVLLGTVCLSLFLFVFLLAPVFTYVFGLSRIWLLSASYLVILCGLTVYLFRRARRKLYPGKADDLFQQTVTIALSPFAAMRANHLTLKDTVGAFHPVAVAQRILPEKEFLVFAREQLRRAKFRYHDTLLEDCIKKLLDHGKTDVQSMLRAPEPDSVHSRSFCPVCLTQYVITAGACGECDGVALQPFAKKEADLEIGAPSKGDA